MVILFVLITFFLLIKLNDILGLRLGFRIEKENLYDLSAQNTVEEATQSQEEPHITKIKKIYPTFCEKDFLEKARKAFEIIFSSYSTGDLKTLKTLLSPRLFHAFSMAIEDRKKRGEILEGILMRFIDSTIVETNLTDEDLFVTVRFDTEQSNVLKSKDGSIIEGNADFVEMHTEVWSFSRKQQSADSRWYLYEIKSE
ncbi:MAG: Tim44/TimA family putative adaptor protein [Holosporaceae bacterium]|nr:Tim44/TimA family putative adaptor protein [Holosporaceae bacterium]